MIRVGLARTRPSYQGLCPPWSEDAHNHVYAAVRKALQALGLDAEHSGTPAWNPLGDLVAPGGRVVLKPNFIRHWNPAENGTLDSVITHGSLLRPLLDYAFMAVGERGSVAIAEAAQHDCDFEEIRRVVGLDALEEVYRERAPGRFEVIDLRREEVRYRDGVIDQRRELPGDPAGYRMVDLGGRSAFVASGLDPSRFRGADYDPGPTTHHHQDGRHQYLLSETVLSADLVLNIPKLKTHKKTGVTLALKNLVGINGDKNLLPHHCVGSAEDGGDEFPGSGAADHLRSRATEVARRMLARGFGTRAVRAVRRLEDALRRPDFVRSGNWHGNRTTWRMCLDLNRCLYYSDASGEYFDGSRPRRKVLTVMDAIVAGEGEGPLAPTDRPLGVVLASLDPVALDLAAIRLMGFEAERVPKVWEAMCGEILRVTDVREPSQVQVVEASTDDAELRSLTLEGIECERSFAAQAGWRGHLETTPCVA